VALTNVDCSTLSSPPISISPCCDHVRSAVGMAHRRASHFSLGDSRVSLDWPRRKHRSQEGPASWLFPLFPRTLKQSLAHANLRSACSCTIWVPGLGIR
jgi:hypothetical protein